MPQLSPLFWMFSTLMIVFLLVSMMMVFYMNSINFNSVDGSSVYFMNWCW
uniref:ATP synthase F0 subunit 8 n=1 Tax=Austrarchaea dianneae TaxID=1028693 RepID=H2E3T3_9ARAC|nr:ATP synthase F0 subunit 8 [Austrarchaea dianneae]AEX88845.1 ATP synthase F0 subunit 8 [Austrarchaea dianneae]AEX88848.1 ATP synthase F0 subunit 8 [Austrarchaea dianneae]